ncbi:MAG: hypothetical protein Q8P46_15125 [Hyphomicrobiales bacterium]|nr:hypothetical protein [Hyphomicrobiales bacterium]
MPRLLFSGTITTGAVTVPFDGEFRIPGFIAGDVGLDAIQPDAPCPEAVKQFIATNVANMPCHDTAWQTVRFAGGAGRGRAIERGIRFDNGAVFQIDRVTVER